jgi:hypothetical protein
MKPEKQTMLLREPEIKPIENVLKNILGKELFDVYEELIRIITTEFDIQYEWRFYKDGKSWLFKAVSKKKTIFWLSVWDGFIKTSFYFIGKNRFGIFDLPISDEIKETFDKVEVIGKLIPLILNIEQKKQLKDFCEIVRYKKSLK